MISAPIEVLAIVGVVALIAAVYTVLFVGAKEVQEDPQATED